ncbi:MAG: NAD(P)H-hydrate dehydratase [Phycisphaeraceae bacterium]|nr:NAD(P)H-hydrate dehydratase [Phycisphaeraceae bacterium]
MGGQSNMLGAPALTALAALRSGAGLVKFVTDKKLLSNLLLLEPSATAVALSDNTVNLEGVLAENDPDERGVLAVGPGMGKTPQSMARLLSLISTNRALVLDADALNLLADSEQILEPSAASRILTPHPGEFRRLAKSLNIELGLVKTKHRVMAATALAKHHHAVVVLKGYQTIVASRTQCYVNQTGNCVLATAGSGDVLTGIISSLIAQGLDGFEAAVLGVYLHGLASDLWVKKNGPVGLLARELADMLPTAIKKYSL